MSGAIITITCRLGRYEGKFAKNARTGAVWFEAGKDPGAAAAKAVDLVLAHQCKSWVILAPEAVMQLIPEHLRNG